MAVLTPAVPVSTFTVLQQKVLVAQIATINAAIAAVTAAVAAGYQPLDSDLTAIAAITGVGFARRTSTGSAWDALALTLPPQGRLTLTTATPVPVADVTAGATVYYTPYVGRFVPIYDGTEWVIYDIGGELSLALDSNAAHTGYHQSGKLFDFFIENSTGTPRLVTGPAWSSNTARAQAISQVNGIYVNTASMTAKFDTSSSTVTVAASRGTYVGSAYMSAGAQTNDSARLRHLWNMYNRVSRKLMRQDTTDTWNYSTNSFQQANASATNQVEVMRGLDEDVVSLSLIAAAFSSTATFRSVLVAIGLDSATTKAADCVNTGGSGSSAVVATLSAAYSGYPGLGYHFLAWLERGGGTDTQTWQGDNGGTALQTGMAGACFA